MSLLLVKFIIYLNCTIFLFANLKSFISSSEFIVEIENGKIIGEDFKDFYAFKGIPYAEAERFEAPQKFIENWSDVRAFKEFGESCAQYDHFSYSYQGIENCLTLNVFIPKRVVKLNQKVPVVVFIHGGAFMFGGSKFYGPQIFMNDQSMILVTINYRVGILGFLSTEDEVLPGNLGLKDQVEALKWIQRNIRAFNGDPNKATISGLSAGGASVHLHYMSKLSKELFNNGISHSGVALNPWVMMEKAREKAHKVGALAGCDFGEDHKNLIKCLKEKPVEELTVIAKHFQPFLYNPFSPFGVVVEPDHKNAFITQHPRDILKSGNFAKQPWIVSQVKDEGLYPGSEFFKEKILNDFDKNWTKFAPFLLDFNGTFNDEKVKEKISTTIKEFYFKDQPISIETFNILIDLLSDRLFKSDFYNALFLQAPQSSTYCYYFSYQTDESKSIINNSPKKLGVAHGDDVFLIFDNRKLSDYNEEEILIGKYFTNLYKKFSTDSSVIFGNSNISKLSIDNFECMHINSNFNYTMKKITNNFGNAEFWNSLKIPE